MIIDKNDCKVAEFFDKNSENLENPIIKSFMSDKRHFELVKEAVLMPTNSNKERVDNAFKKHYTKIKKTKYVSSLIYFFSIDFDKKNRKLNKQQQLILDKSISNDNNTTTPKELIQDESAVISGVFSTRLIDHIENEKLYSGLINLS
ncbi:hypothetical protein [Lederbergia lenta]|uniref:RNA polymerase sigma-B factor (Sigma-37) (General stress protein84) (GSP84) n=1 Tax=Lederbergia lenta TaxID=1467 RepID=A0A2X4WF23_LEDLE|nr:hypothetical protein [Lederbergia lenta]MEC2323087.1 sigma-70 family RNA polymerase sigma factor [Lederbergia lenta]SQI62686.1 RNA polymerase sigma-B factor (sigma-37) (general stress protein84) (GSP84) [Lederbergia lenta]